MFGRRDEEKQEGIPLIKNEMQHHFILLSANVVFKSCCELSSFLMENTV